MPLNDNIEVIVLNTNWANNENYWALFVLIIVTIHTRFTLDMVVVS